jgi:hypothetical protein
MFFELIFNVGIRAKSKPSEPTWISDTTFLAGLNAYSIKKNAQVNSMSHKERDILNMNMHFRKHT